MFFYLSESNVHPHVLEPGAALGEESHAGNCWDIFIFFLGFNVTDKTKKMKGSMSRKGDDGLYLVVLNKIWPMQG